MKTELFQKVYGNEIKSNPSIMKTLFSILTLAVFSLCFHGNINAQDDETAYVVVEYMKVKPGMNDEYRECEAAWKLVHQARLKAGHITSWELERVEYPSGTNTEYDYLTITHYKNWAAINAETGKTFNAAFATLPEDKREIANKAELYRDLVKREIWKAREIITAPDKPRPIYRVENFMSIPFGGWGDFMELEKRFVKPVMAKSTEMGNRSGWLFTQMILPSISAQQEYWFSTIDLFDSWEQMDNSDRDAWEAVYPDMGMGHVYRRMHSARTLVKTEVRRLVDYVE